MKAEDAFNKKTFIQRSEQTTLNSEDFDPSIF